MGKEKPGFLTPKAIANRIKSKGLQKLRWYCQMCEKQCRDENGFKCHTMSESHQRQLLLFADNSSKYMDGFSAEFSNGYINTLRRRFGTKRVHANIVYQEYINDKDHIHMNATKWFTLTDYVKYLGRKGICVVDETEKGWFVTWIDRDPETLRRQAESEKKKKLDLDDRERQQMHLERQMEKAKENEVVRSSEPTELKKSQDELVKISFFKKTSPIVKNEPTSSKYVNANYKKEKEEEDKDDDGYYYYPQNEDEEKEDQDEQADEDEDAYDDEKNKGEERLEIKKDTFKEPLPAAAGTGKFKIPIAFSTAFSSKPTTSHQVSAKPKTSDVFEKPAEKRKLSALDEIMEMEEKKKEKANRKDHWLHKNIVVKIITNKLDDKYYKKKAVVTEVVDFFTGVVKVIETGTVLKLDQAHLETVLPAIGKEVLVVNGAYRGETAILEDINEKKFCAKVSISAGPLKGRVINQMQYEDISKLNN